MHCVDYTQWNVCYTSWFFLPLLWFSICFIETQCKYTTNLFLFSKWMELKSRVGCVFNAELKSSLSIPPSSPSLSLWYVIHFSLLYYFWTLFDVTISTPTRTSLLKGKFVTGTALPCGNFAKQTLRSTKIYITNSCTG